MYKLVNFECPKCKETAEAFDDEVVKCPKCGKNMRIVKFGKRSHNGKDFRWRDI